MGLRFNTNTWRAPLQLIHSWLPAACFTLFRPMAWTAHGSTRSPGSSAVALTSPHTTLAPRPCRVRSVRTINPASGRCTDMRLVISGRISDVCAELDRLAELEHRGLQR